MREIKFRAWIKEYKKMTEVVSLYIAANTIATSETFGIKEHAIKNRFVIDREAELMQFCGLKDKNGAECYESDLVKSNEWIYQVVWGDLGWEFELISRNWSPKNYFSPQHFEIIGNIYENPELLK